MVITGAFVLPEKGVVSSIEKLNAETLSFFLILIALAIIIFAVHPGETVPKAVLLGWLLMP